MLKKTFIFVFFVSWLLAGCSLDDPTSTNDRVRQAKEDLTEYRQTIEITQTLANETDSTTKTQKSIATFVDKKGFEGEIITDDNQQKKILSVISNPRATIYKENTAGWQESTTAESQIERVNIVTYDQIQDVLGIIQTDATWQALPFYYMINFEGENLQLQNLINNIVPEDYHNQVIHNIQIIVNKDNYFIERIRWQIDGKSMQANLPLTSDLTVNYAHQNNTQTNEDFAQTDYFLTHNTQENEE